MKAMETNSTVSRRCPTIEDVIVLTHSLLPSWDLSLSFTSILEFASSPTKKEISDANTILGT